MYFFENYQIDNKFLETNKSEFFINKKKDFKTKNKKVIVVGDSHSEDTFLMFELNKDLFKKYDCDGAGIGSLFHYNYLN